MIKFTRLVKVYLLICHRIFRQVPKLASTRHYHRILFALYVFFLLLLSLLFFAQSRILRDSEIDTKCLFQVRARESNICRKSCNKCMWNVEWHGWVMHIVVVFVPLMSWFCLLLNLELPGFRF